jgi:hypothetical protein
MKKKVAVIGVSLILAVSLLNCTSVSAATYKVGVQVGNVFEYNMSSTRLWSGNLYFTVTNIVGTNVTFSYGDQRYLTGDVATGTNFIWYYLISANLTKGDAIYSGAQYVINQTTSENVLGATRQVNILSQGWGPISEVFTWDQLTGVLISWAQYYNQTQISSRTLTSTNIPLPNILFGSTIIPGIPNILLIGIVVVVVVVAIALTKRKR